MGGLSKFKPYLSIFFKILVILFVIAFTLHPSADLDLGWHLRYGEYFFKTGHVLKDNILSFVWPNYRWVQSSWGFDLMEYQIFNHFSFVGLSITAMLISLATFLVCVWPLKRFNPAILFFLAVIFVSQTVPMNGTGLRSQTLSGLLFALTMLITYLTFKPPSPGKYLNKYLLYSLPLIFFFWANMHGGFSLGLIFATLIWGAHLGLLIIKKMFKLKFETASGKTLLIFAGLLLASWLLPLINPWGLRVYEETFKHSTNANLNFISEWMPLGDIVAIDVVLFLAILCTTLAVIKRQIIQLPFLLIVLVSTYMAISAARFLINFGVLVTIFTAWNIAELPKWKFKGNLILKIVLTFLLVAFTLFDAFFINRYFIIPESRIFTMNWDKYCHYFEHCSEEITQIMLKDPPVGNGFHPYNYGGYLSWRVPKIKTFIDGRMSAWEDDKGNTPPVITADQIVFEKLLQTYRKLDNTYHFRWMIVPTNSPITAYLDDLSKSKIWERRFQSEHLSYFIKVRP
jgi:hypothetical protein